MGIKEIEIKILKLDLKDRATLAKWLIDSLDELPESEIEALWVEEAERRLRSFENGELEALDGKTVVDALRKSLR
ncbi:MAG: addiction module protein [Chlorobiaceae bacterium]|nr:addiction module protein [Chlorobiaceae bacterium]